MKDDPFFMNNKRVICAVLGVVSALAQTPTRPIPPDFFGMHVAVHATHFNTPILAPVEVHAQGKAVVTAWEYLEQSRGVYTWTSLTNALGFSMAHNVPLFYSWQYVPMWATSDVTNCFPAAEAGVFKCPAQPTNEQDWIDFVTTLVNRYKTVGVQTGCSSGNPQCNGVLPMYEGWNEPPFPHPMPITNFIQMQTDYTNTIRAIDPGAQVCSPAFILDPSVPSYQTFLDSFFTNGGLRTYDCYDFHANATTPESQIALVTQFITTLKSYGINPSVLYATEAGRWGDCSVVLSDDDEQAYIARIELLYWTLGVSRHYWYAYDECAPLTNQPTTSTLKPAGVAYGNVENWMIGAVMTKGCAIESGTVWTCALTRACGYKALIVWDTAGPSNYAEPVGFARVRDLDGGVQPIVGAIPIGPKPVMIETR